MHEFSIAQSICDIVTDEIRPLGCRRVTEVTCRIGVMRQVVPDMLTSAFEMAAAQTPMADATLNIEKDPVTITCDACGHQTVGDDLVLTCPACGSSSTRFDGGMDIYVTSITAIQEEADEDNRAA